MRIIIDETIKTQIVKDMALSLWSHLLSEHGSVIAVSKFRTVTKLERCWCSVCH